MNAQTFDIKNQIQNALMVANNAYMVRNPEKKIDGLQADIAHAKRTFDGFSDGMFQALAKMGIAWGEVAMGMGQASNVKIVKRLPQFLGFIVSGDGNYLQASAKTALIEYLALASANVKTKEGLRFASTGKGNENTSDAINIAQARLIQKHFGVIGTSSRETQASVTFSKGGLLSILGMVKPWGKGEGQEKMPVIVDCKTARTLNALINHATEGAIELWAAQSATKGKGKGGKK